MSVTIEDVAKLAGVGKSTVSRVITKHPNVRRTTRERVQAAIAKLNYEPNIYARNILHKKSKAVVLAFAKNVKVMLQYNPYFVEIVHGLEDEGRKLDYLVAPQTIELDKNGLFRIPAILAQNRADGLLVLGHVPDTFFVRLRRAKIPFVSVESASLGESVDCVVPDYFSAGVQATQHLLDLGHRRIGFAVSRTPEPFSSVEERVRGYRWALETGGASFDPSLLLSYDEEQKFWAGERIAQQILAHRGRVTSVIFLDDSPAIRAMQALATAGLHVPEDLSVVGFGDHATAAEANPALTTMKVHTAELGRRALRRLVELIEGGSTLPEKTVLPTRLIRRKSTGPPPRQADAAPPAPERT